MSFAIDLSEYGSDLKKLYESVISSDPLTKYAIFDYDGSRNVLIPGPHGAGDLDEFCEDFDDAKIQYGFSRVEFNGINKVVFVGWVGENVASRQRLLFNSHMASVAKQFSTHHIQITARSSDEVSPAIILERLSAAAGSKYASSTRPAPSTKPQYIKATEGADEDDWEGAEQVEEKELPQSSSGGYKSSVREELEALKKNKKPTAHIPKETSISGLDSGTSYKPVGKIDLKAIREEAKNNKFADARIEKIEPAYKPVGKVDLKAIREQARKEKELKAEKLPSKPVESNPEPAPPSPTASEPAARKEPKAPSLNDDDEPKFLSLSERIKAFQSSVSDAKPQFDIKSSRPTISKPSKFETKTEPKAEPVDAKEDSANVDDDEEAPLSVAAQLAKARLSKAEPEPVAPTPAAPKQTGNVSGFAARFAAKEEPKEPKEEPKEEINEPEEEPEEEPEAPAPPQPKRAVPQPEPEPEAELETEAEAEGLVGHALQDYDAGDEDEISFKDGEDITSIEKVDENWYIGRNKAGKLGMFPAMFVQIAGEPLPPSAPPAPAASESAPSTGSKTATALFDYSAGDKDELSFDEGEVISNIEEVSPEWWSGENSKQEYGLFPSNYVKLD